MSNVATVSITPAPRIGFPSASLSTGPFGTELQHEPGCVLRERESAVPILDAGAHVDAGTRGLKRLAGRGRGEDVSEALRRVERAARVLPVGEGGRVNLGSVDPAKGRWERPLDDRLVVADDRLPRQTDGRIAAATTTTAAAATKRMRVCCISLFLSSCSRRSAPARRCMVGEKLGARVPVTEVHRHAAAIAFVFVAQHPVELIRRAPDLCPPVGLCRRTITRPLATSMSPSVPAAPTPASPQSDAFRSDRHRRTAVADSSERCPRASARDAMSRSRNGRRFRLRGVGGRVVDLVCARSSSSATGNPVQRAVQTRIPRADS